MWRFTHFTARTLPLTFILSQTLQRRRFVSLKTLCINHIKSPGNKSGGWQHQTNTPISHCVLFSRVSHREGGADYSGISHTVKAKRTYRLAHSTSTETSGLLCTQLQNTQIKEHKMDFCFLMHHVAQPFSLQGPHTRSSHTHIQTHH